MILALIFEVFLHRSKPTGEIIEFALLEPFNFAFLSTSQNKGHVNILRISQ